MSANLTADAIRFAFRMMVGREATDAEIAPLLDAGSEAELRERLLVSTAFAVGLQRRTIARPMDRPPARIAVTGPREAIDRMLARVQAKWTELGKVRPHWSVNALDEFLPDRIDSHQADFAASGERDAAVLIARLARHGLAPAMLPRLCDFGCGIGRVTIPLARAFPQVIACDVSASHLELARLTTARAGLGHVRYSLVTLPDFGMGERFDCWYCYVVLQHNPAPLNRLMLARMFALLAPGGVAVFQAPTDVAGYCFDLDVYLDSPPTSEAFEIHVTPQSMIFGVAAEAGCVPLEVETDDALWPPTVVTSNIFMFRKPTF